MGQIELFDIKLSANERAIELFQIELVDYVTSCKQITDV